MSGVALVVVGTILLLFAFFEYYLFNLFVVCILLEGSSDIVELMCLSVPGLIPVNHITMSDGHNLQQLNVELFETL